MSKDKMNGIFKAGTAQCGAFCAACGALLAVLLISIGFWKTLFIFAFAAIGLFIGLVEDKKGAIRRVINHSIPGETKVDTFEDMKNKEE